MALSLNFRAKISRFRSKNYFPNFWLHVSNLFYVIFVSHLRVDFSAQKIINTSSALFLSHCFLIENDKRRMRREREEERCNRRKFNIRSVEERLTFCSNEKITMTKGKTGITHNKTTVTTHITGSAEPKFSFFKNTDMQLLKKALPRKFACKWTWNFRWIGRLIGIFVPWKLNA